MGAAEAGCLPVCVLSFLRSLPGVGVAAAAGDLTAQHPVSADVAVVLFIHTGRCLFHELDAATQRALSWLLEAGLQVGRAGLILRSYRLETEAQAWGLARGPRVPRQGPFPAALPPGQASSSALLLLGQEDSRPP